MFTKVRQPAVEGDAPNTQESTAPAASPPVESAPRIAFPEEVTHPQPSEVTRESILARLSRQANRLDALIDELIKHGDVEGAQRWIAKVLQTDNNLARLLGDVDKGDTIRVRVEDMQAAADRAVEGLHKLAEHVAAERASWPKCAACGQPHGEFPPAERSPLRALVERVFGAVPS